jgi:hypothetical protein
MRKKKADQAKKHLEKIQELMSQVKSPFEGMSKQEAIEKCEK